MLRFLLDSTDRQLHEQAQARIVGKMIMSGRQSVESAAESAPRIFTLAQSAAVAKAGVEMVIGACAQSGGEGPWTGSGARTWTCDASSTRPPPKQDADSADRQRR